MPCSVKDYIEREKRLIDISILAGCHVLLMKSPPPPGTRFRETARKSYLPNGDHRTTGPANSPPTKNLDCTRFVRFSVFINSLIDVHIYIGNLPNLNKS